MTDAVLASTNGKVADIYIEAAEMITELRQEIAQIKERLESSHHASTSNTGRGLLDVDEDEDYFEVLKNVTKIDAAAAELGDFSWLPGLALEDGVLTFVRTLSVACGFCSLVVQVVKEKREGLRKLAKVWAKKKNVVMVPYLFFVVVVGYLSRPSMLLRQERTAIYKGLAEAGAGPKWTGSADIEYLNGEGERVLFQF
ncbi:hypothetical protein CHLRE_15g643000v5 [Chlamydomonas reinhardtii]|uniref:Uncharacterized protein n=1 Tax=Chlamydomonas reinhardtii TaxID=3055 RepID=A0A2K3CX13_CHLRE|nr:uncharacterized protein CHLRE_15g643000v5 [Chlamydomonas reinhardtii]PNW72827.1 hypothetical protein CHLRE_15g643000v5 [Chlamydomonas reinhardtii]